MTNYILLFTVALGNNSSQQLVLNYIINLLTTKKYERGYMKSLIYNITFISNSNTYDMGEIGQHPKLIW